MPKQVDSATLAAALQQARGEHLDTGPCTIEIADAAAIYAQLPDQPDALTLASPEANGLREAVDALEDVLTGHDWLGTGGPGYPEEEEEREAWRQWDVIRAALGLSPAQVYDWQIATSAAAGESTTDQPTVEGEQP